MTSAVTEKFGPYEVLDRLGRGGMGLVYRAWDGRLHREVAIKLLSTECPEPGMHERFLQEARAASVLNHPNICTVFDIGEKAGTPYMVMELLQGQTLKARLEHSPIPADEIVQFSQEIADALGAAHARGIIHRDIKPANIFLVQRPNGGSQTKILDFGLAKMEVPDGPITGRLPLRSEHATSEGATAGTVAYMSPEQARGESLDGRTDLFSLGVTMYEMATRRLPFPGTTSALAFVQLLNHPPEPIRDWNASVSRELERIILKLLEKDPAARFQTAVELCSALYGLPQGSGKSRSPRHAPPLPLPLLQPADVPLESWLLRPAPASAGNADASSSPALQNAGPASPASPVLLARLSEEAPLLPPAPPRAVPLPATPKEPSAPACVQVATPLRSNIPASGASTPVAGASISAPPRAAKAQTSSHVRVSSAGVADTARRKVAEEIDPVSMLRGMVAPAAPAGVNTLPEMKEELAPPPHDLPPARLPRSKRLAVAALLAIVCATIALLCIRNLLHRSPVLGPADRLMIAAIENATGDSSLDGVAITALEIALEESPNLNVSEDDYRAALRQLSSAAGQPSTQALARRAAQAVGARAYLYGSLRSSGNTYDLSIGIFDAATGHKLAAAQTTAPTRDRLADAIDRAAAKLRSDLRVDVASTPSYIPLSREATANLDALHSYALGEDALLDGRTDQALAAFQSAASLDPHFTQAQLQLASLYASDRAESAAAAAARLANASAANASARTSLLAQYAYEIDATGNLSRATDVARHFATLYPLDPAGARNLSEIQRLDGKFDAALDAAQRGLVADPSDAALYREAELSLIALNRYDDALALVQKSAQLASANDDLALTTAYLAAKPDLLATSVERAARPPRSIASMAAYGLYLDDSGQLAVGETLWRATAAGLDSSDAAAQSASWLLAQGALDRALAADCSEALNMARTATVSAQKPQPQDMTARFNAGFTAALCGNKSLAQQAIASFSHDWPEASAVAGQYLPDLNAALALSAHNPQAALDALKPAAQSDAVSLTPYLRGLAHLALRQPQLAIADLQPVLAHHGVVLATDSNLYPMAEIALARAYAQAGDKANSTQAYKKFLDLWPNADTSERLWQEATAAVAR
jgi:serine/threonine-protein kinase